jgi:hypothetical protein
MESFGVHGLTKKPIIALMEDRLWLIYGFKTTPQVGQHFPLAPLL